MDSLAEDTLRQIKLGNSFAEQIRSEYSGARLQWAETMFATYANWWRKKGYKSSCAPHTISIWDRPLDNSCLALMPDLPVRNQAREVIDMQPQCFRNTQDPDILRREAFPNWYKDLPPIRDNWPESGWQSPQGPEENCYGRAFWTFVRGDLNYRALHEQFELPDWLLGARSGLLIPPYTSKL